MNVEKGNYLIEDEDLLYHELKVVLVNNSALFHNENLSDEDFMEHIEYNADILLKTLKGER